MAKLVFRCHQCGTAVPLSPGEKVMRHHECAKCEADLLCCRNCRHFDPGRNNQCAESQAEWVSNKESRNFCDFFEPRTTIDLNAGRTAGRPDSDPRKLFDDLFK